MSTPLRFSRSTRDKIFLPNYNRSSKHARPLGGDKLYARYQKNSLSRQSMFLISNQKTSFWATKLKVTPKERWTKCDITMYQICSIIRIQMETQKPEFSKFSL